MNAENRYTMKMQRDVYMLTLENDIILYSQRDKGIKYNQLAAGRKAFKKRWDNTMFRVLFNIALPVVMFAMDITLLLRFSWCICGRKRVEVNEKRFFIGHRRILYSISKRANILKDQDVWIRLLDDTYVLPEAVKQVSIEDIVTYSEVLKSWVQSIFIHARTIIELGYDKYFLSLKSFLWCMEDYALRHLPSDSEILYEDICDRNAILFDRLPFAKKVMVQHGTMHYGSAKKDNPYMTFYSDKGFYVWNSLYKSSPDLVYCFTKDDEWALKTSIIANDPMFIYVGYGFQPTYKPDKKSVLLVGNYYLYKDKEEYIIKNLQELDIIIYLKNHPSHPDSIYDELRNRYNFQFIKGVETHYPAVDLLISYNSTLAFEYASIGTKVLYYGQFDEDNIREKVKSLFGMI